MSNQNFITRAGLPLGPAVDASYVYWGNVGPRSAGRTWTGRASTRASSPAPTPSDVAVDAKLRLLGRWLLPTRSAGRTRTGRASTRTSSPAPPTPSPWRSTPTTSTGPTQLTNTIGRANLDGTGVNQNFITGASDPNGVAVDANHVYWANYVTNAIGRANLDGTGVNQSFITGASPLPTAWRSTPTTSTGPTTPPARSAGRTWTEPVSNQSFITGADPPGGRGGRHRLRANGPNGPVALPNGPVASPRLNKPYYENDCHCIANRYAGGIGVQSTRYLAGVAYPTNLAQPSGCPGIPQRRETGLAPVSFRSAVPQCADEVGQRGQ